MLAVSWRDILLAVMPSAQLSAGVPAPDLAAAADRLGPLPEDLATLLAETDGVRSPDGVELIWSVDRVVRENADAKTDDLLLFGDDDAGGGDRIAFGPPGPVRIWLWTPGTGERQPLATNLADYFTRVLVVDGDAG
ncbi:SMI1/KNR4 family protein [Actinoplanes sp. RD1]|uniref:SMI1/KNR4 family protein n=1 Tax=Actinoplanes sp. RD1 TaxID=3064538 RepID=UPI00274148DB|nr:SMI1/KNR4 family protein [Actinoplanes sp. RD1]